MFDVDGVITEPFSKRINPAIINFIAAKLDANIPISVYTGRSYDFVDTRVVQLLKRSVSALTKLDNLVISSEVGMHNVTFRSGTPVEHIDKTYNIPDTLKKTVANLTKGTSGIFIDPTKQCMMTIESEGGSDTNELDKQHTTLNSLEKSLGKILQNYPSLYLLRHVISLDILDKRASKKLSARFFVNFLKNRKSDNRNYIIFGDSTSDMAASDELNDQGYPVRFVYVGKGDTPTAAYAVYTIPGVYFDEATVQVLERF